MSLMEIILLVAGALVFIISFFVPDKSREQEAIDVDMEAVRKMVDNRVESARGRLEEIVDESVRYAVEKSERSLERVSNDKIMAVGEYSEAVLADIDKNHQEVLFLYDMLNEKAVDMKNSVREAEQVQRDARILLRQVSETSHAAMRSMGGPAEEALAAAAQKQADMTTYQGSAATQDMTAGQASAFAPGASGQVAAFGPGNFRRPGETPEIKIPDFLKSPVPSRGDGAEVSRPVSGPAETSGSPEPFEGNPVEAMAADRIAARRTAAEEFSRGLGGIAPAVAADTDRILRKAGIQAPSGAENAGETAGQSMPAANDRNVDIHFGPASSGGNKNEKILQLHRSGKSNVEIARMLDLGIGEVKLVIDLFEGAK